MVAVPAGAFDMGAPPGDSAAAADESPRHRVRIARPFAVGIYEVTVGEYRRFATDTGATDAGGCQAVSDGRWVAAAGRSWREPGFRQGDRDPVVCISWEEAQRFVGWLTRRTGSRYRLPTEAEWEYLASDPGGAPGLSHDTANYGAQECCRGRVEGRDAWEYTAPVGSFPPNRFGLHDLLGNVWEWLEDCYHASYAGAPQDGRAWMRDCEPPRRRVVRGGSYGDAAELLRSSYRLRARPGNRYATVGFRVARDLGQSP
jgi:formylglycine-generating enzyme required for sulfatase activity